MIFMRIHIGTSGWLYPWNKGNSLDWYVRESGMDAIELNSSFYRFPYPNQVKSWARAGKSLAWAVKVHRSVTHTHMLNESAIELCDKFLNAMSPLDKITSWYLIQLPPRFTSKLLPRLNDFLSAFNSRRLAIEFRHASWNDFDMSKIKTQGAVVTADSPLQSGRLTNLNKQLYLRFHGRTEWYSYNYGKRELAGMVAMVAESGARRAFAFFNNDKYMLSNAKEFKKLIMRY